MLHIFLTTFLLLAYSPIKNNYGRIFYVTFACDSRIIGGQPAGIRQFPFAVALNITTEQTSYFCGGTLINRDWVITAAQCINNATSIMADVGSNYLMGVDPFRQRWHTGKWVAHPDYNPQTLENDIGLVKLRVPLQVVTIRIEPISELPSDEFETDSEAMVIGWGQLSDNSDLVEELQYVNVHAVSNAECRITFGDQIKDTMLCTRGATNQGTCIDDTGGPLVEPTEEGNGRLVAIASFISGNGCESIDPSGYIRVFPYVDWIEDTIAEG